MDSNLEALRTLCSDFCPLDDIALNRFKIYSDMLIEWNKKINLTAICDPGEIIIKHFYDSLLIFKYADIKNGDSLADVGTGAGFPGMVLKIAHPDLNVTLIDSLNKRLLFLKEVSGELNLSVDIVHSRAEDAGMNKHYRESFNVVTARAVANMNVLAEYCLPLVSVGGQFIAMKGPAALEEAPKAINAIAKLGGSKIECKEGSLPDGSERIFCTVKKISQTPPQFPRNFSKITKKPL